MGENADLRGNIPYVLFGGYSGNIQVSPLSFKDETSILDNSFWVCSVLMNKFLLNGQFKAFLSSILGEKKFARTLVCDISCKRFS